MDTKPTGIELIAAERERQITAEGWSAAHDDEHLAGEMTEAAWRSRLNQTDSRGLRR